MEKKFYEIDEYGQLYIDRIFFETSYPILFTCTDDLHNLFICVCCQNNARGRKWLISKTSSADIVELLKNKMTIREIFIKESSCRFSIFQFDSEIVVKKNDKKDWSKDSIYLPKEGEYLDADLDEFEDDICYYECYDLQPYLENYVQYIEPIASLLQNSFSSVIGNFYVGVVEDVAKVISSVITKSFAEIELPMLNTLRNFGGDYVAPIAKVSPVEIDLTNMNMELVIDVNVRKFNDDSYLKAA